MKLQRQRVHVWHIELHADHWQPGNLGPRDYRLERVKYPTPELGRFLYLTVGAPWNWYMRLNWSWGEWQDYLAQPGIEMWIAYRDGAPAGYFELDRASRDDVEIVYFGIMPAQIGQGMGRRFLEDAIATAFTGKADSSGERANRIWLHTCSLDHPAALPNYLARGFAVFREEDFMDEVPAEPIPPWQGANRQAGD